MKQIDKFKKFTLDSILFAIATGFNKGSMLLIFPILLTFLTVEQYGMFSLILTVAQMLISLLTLSGTTAILREGSDDFSIGVYLLKKFIFIVLINSIVLFAVFYLFFDRWILYSLAFASLNAIYELFLSFSRVIDNKKQYFNITLIKILIIFIVVLIAKHNRMNLENLFLLLICTLSLPVFYLLIKTYKHYMEIYGIKNIVFLNVLKYTIFVIPHGLSLWAMNSSDKLIIKYFLNETMLGVYSIAYTIGSFQILLNSGLSIALPQNIYQNYNFWLQIKPRLKMIILFSLASLVLTIFIIFGIKFDREYFHFLIHISLIKNILVYISIGLYIAGIYQFYSIYIFYHKKTKSLFKISVFIALFGILLNFIYIPIYGIIGAAITTMVSYLLYLILVIIYVIHIEKRLKKNIYIELSIIILNSCCIYLVFYFIS